MYATGLTTQGTWVGSVVFGPDPLIDCPPNGDANRDSNLTSADALPAFRHFLDITELDACQQTHADVTADSNITLADALWVFQKFLSLPSCLD